MNGTATDKKKVFIKTYGCQMNVYDSARMSDVLNGAGYAETATPEAAMVNVSESDCVASATATAVIFGAFADVLGTTAGGV